MNTFKIIFAVLAVLVNTYAFYPYLRDIFSKQTKPHTYTWLIWTITQGTAVAGLWYGHGNLGSIELAIGTFFVFFIFLLSLFRGTKNITYSDTIILIISLLAVFVWWKLNNPILAVFMVTGIDIFGTIPTIRKSWIDPHSETMISWGLFSLANFLSILALGSYNLLTVTYLSAITILDLIVFMVCFYRRKKINI